jgi:hypothetical protein
VSVQPSTFNPLPSREDLLSKIEQQKAHIADLTSYMSFIVPVSERFGDRVFDVAAAFLLEKGFPVTPAQLRELAQELGTPEGMARHAEVKRLRASLLFGGGSGPPKADADRRGPEG